MKKSLLLAGLFAVATGFSAYADNENVVNIPWELSTVHNGVTDENAYASDGYIVSSNVDRIQIKLVKPAAMENAEWSSLCGNYQVDAEKIVTVSNGEAEFSSTTITQGFSYIMLNVNFNEPITVEGAYSIDVPEGLVKFSNGSVSEATNIENAFTVKNVWKPSFASYILDPKDGATVKSLNQVRVTFPNAIDIMDDDMTVEINTDLFTTPQKYITLTVGQSENPYCTADKVEMIDAFTALITFNSSIANGEYTLTIPGGMFYCSADRKATNLGIIATYTLEQSSVSLDNYSFTPEPLVSQPSIKEIVLSFNYLFKVTEANVDPLENGDFSMFDLVNGNNEKFACTGVEFGDDEKSLVINYDEITEDGSYTLTLPAGLFATDVPNEPEVASPAISATFVVGTGSYVASVFQGEDSIDAVDLAGRVVLRGADAAAVSSLEPGIYVINGKKVVIRK